MGEVHTDQEMVIGKAIIRAYQMEQLQDWVGCWVDEPCVKRIPSDMCEDLQTYLLIRYRVPLKSGPMQEAWALNWTFSVAHLRGSLFQTAWRRVWKRASEGPISWESRRKLEQTDRFMFMGGLLRGRTASRIQTEMLAGYAKEALRVLLTDARDIGSLLPDDDTEPGSLSSMVQKRGRDYFR